MLSDLTMPTYWWDCCSPTWRCDWRGGSISMVWLQKTTRLSNKWDNTKLMSASRQTIRIYIVVGNSKQVDLSLPVQFSGTRYLHNWHCLRGVSDESTGKFRTYFSSSVRSYHCMLQSKFKNLHKWRSACNLIWNAYQHSAFALIAPW